jgi:hypothetical protein
VITLDAEHIAGSLARSRKLPTATVGELMRRAGIGTGTAGHVPLIGNRDCFREVQRHCPAAERGGAGIGHTHVHLTESTPGIRWCCRTGIRGECLAARQQTGQQHSIFNKNLHLKPLHINYLRDLVVFSETDSGPDIFYVYGCIRINQKSIPKRHRKTSIRPQACKPVLLGLRHCPGDTCIRKPATVVEFPQDGPDLRRIQAAAIWISFFPIWRSFYRIPE